MKVTLTQSSGQGILRGWIVIRIETEDICTQIWTSSTFSPYKELYIWLGQIRDLQLPAKTIVDEEGRGVELIAEQLNDELLYFHIDPWLCGNDNVIRLKVTVSRCELIKAFYHGIREFIESEYNPLEWSNIDDLSNINWKALLKPVKFPGQNWQTRLAMYGGGHGRVPETGRESIWQQLTTEQQWLVVMHDILGKVTFLAADDCKKEAYALFSLYQDLPIDLALGEFDPSWYEEREAEIDREFGGLKLAGYRRNPKHLRLAARTRFATLKIGQLVDGRVYQIKPYGVIVDIVGYYALLHNSTISQLSIEHPEQVFQIDDWVRAIIVWINAEKGRVLLSTSDLEPKPGDMLREPMTVYEKAEEMATRYCQHKLSKFEG